MSRKPTHLDMAAGAIVGIGLVVCVLAFVRSSWSAADVDKYDYAKELVFHVAVLSAAALCCIGSISVVPSWIDAAFLLFVGWGVLSALAARPPNQWMAWRSVALSSTSVIAFWTAGYLSARGLRRLLLVAIGIAVAIGAAAVVLEAQSDIGASLYMRGPSGTQGVRNYAAHFIAIGLPVLGFLVFSARSSRSALVAAGGVTFSAAALVLTRSRASWLATGALVAIAVLRLFLERPLAEPARKRIALLCGAGVLGVSFALWAPHRLTWREEAPYLTSARNLVDTDSGSGRGRVLQYRNTLKMIFAHPLLGVGPGQWSVYYPLYAPPDDPTNKPMAVWNVPARSASDWIGLAAERGIPGVGTLAIMFVLMTVESIRRLRGTEDSSLSFVVVSTCLAAGIIAVVDCPLQMALPNFLLFTLWGISSPPRGEGLRLIKPMRIGCSVSVAALAIALALFGVRQIRALRLASSADKPEEWERAAQVALGHPRIQLAAAFAWLDAGRPDLAATHAKAALRLNPQLTRARLIAGSK